MRRASNGRPSEDVIEWRQDAKRLLTNAALDGSIDAVFGLSDGYGHPCRWTASPRN
jgi:hypothetical protein